MTFNFELVQRRFLKREVVSILALSFLYVCPSLCYLRVTSASGKTDYFLL